MIKGEKTDNKVRILCRECFAKMEVNSTEIFGEIYSEEGECEIECPECGCINVITAETPKSRFSF